MSYTDKDRIEKDIQIRRELSIVCVNRDRKYPITHLHKLLTALLDIYTNLFRL